MHCSCRDRWATHGRGGKIPGRDAADRTSRCTAPRVPPRRPLLREYHTRVCCDVHCRSRQLHGRGWSRGPAGKGSAAQQLTGLRRRQRSACRGARAPGDRRGYGGCREDGNALRKALDMYATAAPDEWGLWAGETPRDALRGSPRIGSGVDGIAPGMRPPPPSHGRGSRPAAGRRMVRRNAVPLLPTEGRASPPYWCHLTHMSVTQKKTQWQKL
jgi:hypothetical protein